MAFYRVKHLCREGYAVTDVIEAPNHQEARRRYDDVLSVCRTRNPLGRILRISLLLVIALAALVSVFCFF